MLSTKPKLLSFDVFGTLIDVRSSTYPAFSSILKDCGADHVELKAFWEFWEHCNIKQYWEPYKSYREICENSLEQAFVHYNVEGDTRLISRYFEAFPNLRLYPDVTPVLESFAAEYRLAVVSNIDDDLFAETPLNRDFDLVCTAERARGYKADGTLFRYLIENANCALDEILHSGQSQFTDMVGGKPLGLTIAWINRRGVELHPEVPRPDYQFADLTQLAQLVSSESSSRRE